MIRGSLVGARRCAAGPGLSAFESWRRVSSFVGAGAGGGGNAGALSRCGDSSTTSPVISSTVSDDSDVVDGGGGCDGRAGARGAAVGSVCVRTVDESFGALGGIGAACGPLADDGRTGGGAVVDDRRGGSWIPVGGALRARARGGNGGKRRPHAWQTARSSLFSALQNGQKRIRAHEPYPMKVSR
jgi:hypothetical protein